MLTNNKDQNYIYYYTSNDTLKSILINKKIWATRSITSNDAMDTFYMIDILEELKREWKLDELWKCLFDVVINNLKQSKRFNTNVIKEKLCNIIKQKLLLNEGNISLDIDEIKKIFLLNETDQSLPFVICFSKNPDSRFFWDTYTKNRGANIKFIKDELVDFFKQKYLHNEVSNIRADYVIYDKYKQKQKVKDIIEKIYNKDVPNFDKYSDEDFEILKKEFKGYNRDTIKIFLIANKIAFELTREAPFLKHPFWAEENEFRIVFYEKYLNSYNFDIKENYYTKYNNDCKTQDYIEIDIPIDKIKHVIFGPTNPETESLKKLLDEKNIYTSKSIGTDVIKNMKI